MRQGMLEGRTGFRGKEQKKRERERERKKELNEWWKMVKNGRGLEKGECTRQESGSPLAESNDSTLYLSAGFMGDARARCRLCGSFDREIA